MRPGRRLKEKAGPPPRRIRPIPRTFCPVRQLQPLYRRSFPTLSSSGNLLPHTRLCDLELQDRLRGPPHHCVWRHPAAGPDALLGHAKPVTPERMALREGTTETSVFGNPGPIPFNEATTRHFDNLFPLTMLTNQESFSLSIIAGTMPFARRLFPSLPPSTDRY